MAHGVIPEGVAMRGYVIGIYLASFPGRFEGEDLVYTVDACALGRGCGYARLGSDTVGQSSRAAIFADSAGQNARTVPRLFPMGVFPQNSRIS